MDSNLKRRPLKRKRAAIGLGLLIALAWLYLGNTRIGVSRQIIADEKIPAGFHGFRMAQVSDLHNQDWSGQLIGLLQKEAPDVILITGDLIDSNHLDLPVALEFAKRARAIAPVYFVTGNHEEWSGRYTELKENLQALDITILENQALPLERNGDVIQLLGVDDPEFLAGGADDYEAMGAMDAALNEAAGEETAFQILLAHRPELLATYAAHQIDLVLSGHAHGGQFRVPFLGGIYAPGQGFFPKYSAGLYTSGQTRMIVSRGLGRSVIPIRFNNPPELVIIELKSSAQSAAKSSR